MDNTNINFSWKDNYDNNFARDTIHSIGWDKICLPRVRGVK